MNFIEQSRILPLLFATLSRYGRSGRFHYLDILATNRQNRFDPPQAFWTPLENHITRNDVMWEPFSGRNADELNDWWFCIHRLGVQGCFGELGKNMGWAICLSGWPTPDHLK